MRAFWFAFFFLLPFAACGGASEDNEKTAPLIDGGRARDSGGKVPPGTPVDEAGTPIVDAGDDGALTFCPAPGPTTYPAYLKPVSHVHPCTTDDYLFYTQNSPKPFDEQKSLMAARNPTCAVCIFTKEADTEWGPITKTNDGRIFVGYHLCISLAGGSDGCASADFQAEWCRQKVCNVCLTGKNEHDCLTESKASGDCSAKFTAAGQACASENPTINQTCGNNGSVVKKLCVAGN